MHDALGTGKEEFLGKAAIVLKVGPPSDHWIVLRARDGAESENVGL